MRSPEQVDTTAVEVRQSRIFSIFSPILLGVIGFPSRLTWDYRERKKQSPGLGRIVAVRRLVELGYQENLRDKKPAVDKMGNGSTPNRRSAEDSHCERKTATVNG